MVEKYRNLRQVEGQAYASERARKVNSNNQKGTKLGSLS